MGGGPGPCACPVSARGTTVSFSGPTTAALRALEQGAAGPDLALAVLECVADTLARLVVGALRSLRRKRCLWRQRCLRRKPRAVGRRGAAAAGGGAVAGVLAVGGVLANGLVKERLRGHVRGGRVALLVCRAPLQRGQRGGVGGGGRGGRGRTALADVSDGYGRGMVISAYCRHAGITAIMAVVCSK